MASRTKFIVKIEGRNSIPQGKTYECEIKSIAFRPGKYADKLYFSLQIKK